MIVVSQSGNTIIPFEKFIFSKSENFIIVAPDYVINREEVKTRIIAEYPSKEETEEAFKKMIAAYAIGTCRVFSFNENIEVEA